jgi:murein DD-endopeptidase MepM/ murein hydrolase activator NlpD
MPPTVLDMGLRHGMRGCAGTIVFVGAVLGALVPAANAYAGGTPAPSATGGSEYGGALASVHPVRPVARIFTVNPKVVVAPRLPRLRVRVDQPGSRTVRARLVFLPRTETGAIVRIDAGELPTGRRVAVNWPAGSQLAPGRYLVRLHVRGLGNRVLARTASSSGRTTVTVRAPAPPAPAPPPTAPAVVPPPGPGVFPVAGPHTYGDAFGAARKGYSHQGQDLAAAEGVPVVAPQAGTILYVDFQAKAAGWYIVQRGADGRDFFFAHCQANSVVVKAGQAVTPGQPLCNVGSTGDATGPHLHFEIWLGGWRVDAASRPVDPLADLQAWDPAV